jgi:hypothetical protein
MEMRVAIDSKIKKMSENGQHLFNVEMNRVLDAINWAENAWIKNMRTLIENKVSLALNEMGIPTPEAEDDDEW